MSTAVIDPQDQPSTDKPGDLVRWSAEALARVLADNPEVLDWEEVDRLAEQARRDRLILSRYEPASITRDEMVNRLLDEMAVHPSASGLSKTQPRSAVADEMETTNDA